MNEQGQMDIDYIIGISIFLVGIIFVFTYTTGLFSPFQSNSDEITLIADRVATNIVEQTLTAGDPDTINLLSETKTRNFFLEFEDNYPGIVDYYGLNGTYTHYSLNVSIEDDTGTIYQGGEVLPPNMNIGQTKRVVLIREDDTGDVSQATLSVRIW